MSTVLLTHLTMIPIRLHKSLQHMHLWWTQHIRQVCMHEQMDINSSIPITPGQKSHYEHRYCQYSDIADACAEDELYSISELSLPDINNLSKTPSTGKHNARNNLVVNITEITENIICSIIKKILALFVKLVLCDDKTSKTSCLADIWKILNIDDISKLISSQL